MPSATRHVQAVSKASIQRCTTSWSARSIGLAPSPAFDPEYYRHRNPDLSAAAINRFHHYLAHGRAEGRRGISVSETLAFDRQRLDASRETILLFAHDASRTGAPIIAYHIALRLQQKYNVVAVLLGAGELFPVFESCCAAVVGPIPHTEWCEVEARHLVTRLCASYRVLYAIANSIETRMVLPALAHAHVPVVTLVHEFASYTRPAGSMGQALDWSTQVVFPAAIVAGAAQREHPTLRGRTVHVLPQGTCPAPLAEGARETASTVDALLELRRQKDQRTRAGRVRVRHGAPQEGRRSVSLVRGRCGQARPETSGAIRVDRRGDISRSTITSYSCYLADQIERSGLGTTTSIIDAIADVEPAYALADVFFLSSRLDPLPNVTIDAALRAIPVVCFEGATGMADLLAADALASQCVVPYLDVGAAAGVIARLADNEQERIEIGEATRRIAQATFDTDRYVRRLDELGIDAVRIMRQRKEDFDTLRNDPLFDASVYLHPKRQTSTRDEAINGFLARWFAVGLLRHPRRTVCSGAHASAFTRRSTRTRTAIATMPRASTRSRTSFAAAGRMVRGVTK